MTNPNDGQTFPRRVIAINLQPHHVTQWEARYGCSAIEAPGVPLIGHRLIWIIAEGHKGVGLWRPEAQS